MSLLKYPLATEKCIRMMEAENKLVFIVERNAKKDQIKKEIEARFNVKVLRVNTLISFRGKKAFVTFHPDNPAIDIATTLGLM